MGNNASLDDDPHLQTDLNFLSQFQLGNALLSDNISTSASEGLTDGLIPKDSSASAPLEASKTFKNILPTSSLDYISTLNRLSEVLSSTSAEGLTSSSPKEGAAGKQLATGGMDADANKALLEESSSMQAKEATRMLKKRFVLLKVREGEGTKAKRQQHITYHYHC